MNEEIKKIEELESENVEEQTSDVSAPEENPQPENVEEQTSDVSASEKKPDKKKIGIIAGIAVAVVAVIVVLAVVLGGQLGGVSGEIFTGSGDYTEEPNPERDDFISALGGVSETFAGVVSQESFESSDDAAKAFINDEISGKSGATIQSLNHRGSLSKKQIQSLNISEEILEGSESVDVIDVSYTLQSTPAQGAKSGAAVDNGSDKTVTVIVIKYSDYWKYFTPMPVNGNTISKSYYDSVFNHEKYENCTMAVSQDIDVDISAAGQTMTMKMKLIQKVKYADGKIYMEMILDSDTFGSVVNSNVYLYIEKVDGKTVCYVKQSENAKWVKANLASVGYSDIEELTPFYDQYLDYSYFTKTSFGFTLADENAKSYFSQALMAALEAYKEYIDLDDMDIDMYAEYYVFDGALSGMRVDADVDMEMNIAGTTGSISEKVVSVCKCYDYGTTSIERPDVD